MNQTIILRSGEEWAVQPDGDVPMLVAKTLNGHRVPTAEELERAAHFLNEATSSSVTLFCHNKECKDFGSWIQRGTDDAKKNVYTCELCHKLMER